MLQCESSSGMAGAALLRLYRMVRAGEVVALVALVSWSSWYVPSLVAAALRLAGSLLLNARFVFLLGNAIVLLLFALSRHDLSSSSSSSSTSDQQQPAAAASSSSTTPLQQQQAPSLSSVPPPVAAADAATAATSFPVSSTTTTLPSSISMEAAAASFAAPVIARADAVLLEDKPVVAAAVRKLARAPRRSRSEKMGPRRAASPELRRCESENGRRRRSSVTARDAEACWGREDADEFRRTVEAFIARQTRFHREESMSMAGHCEVAPAFTGALVVVE
ncbi:hypothetical protein PR202_ga06082 [Eleusine coracana subsp. coracana]|uniref:Uncharacterized protein n=1 Tax=Eleusine coracana subsp. coracana TaxID=191504 RepID=A0AAV5BWC1_ELECO|nr:hypothetical protein QOZ80_5AG0361840 [Eleusine coracana subsp. coracana]GJM89858.1 hypothetical protein PR202_ga06082 [Eleusine coracana subsp. coracana]